MNDRRSHLDEDAELYALGMLDDAERARVDAHVRECGPCSERLGRAEAAVAALAEAGVAAAPPAALAATRRRRRRANIPAWSAAAAAAALAISTGTLGAQNAALRGELGSDGGALTAMVRSHFVHAQFRAPSGTPIDAKVVYERHGRWYEVLALGAGPGWRLAVERDGRTAVDVPQRFARRGEVGVLMLVAAGPVRELQLRDAAGALVGSVRPVLAGEDEAGAIRESGAVSLNR